MWISFMISLWTFWRVKVVVKYMSLGGQKALRFNQKDLHLCSEDEWKYYSFGPTLGWVINDNFHFWVKWPSILYYLQEIKNTILLRFEVHYSCKLNTITITSLSEK